MIEPLFGYAIVAVGIIALLAIYTLIAAWWLRWAATRWFGWSPPEPKGREKKAKLTNESDK